MARKDYKQCRKPCHFAEEPMQLLLITIEYKWKGGSCKKTVFQSFRLVVESDYLYLALISLNHVCGFTQIPFSFSAYLFLTFCEFWVTKLRVNTVSLRDSVWMYPIGVQGLESIEVDWGWVEERKIRREAAGNVTSKWQIVKAENSCLHLQFPSSFRWKGEDSWKYQEIIKFVFSVGYS